MVRSGLFNQHRGYIIRTNQKHKESVCKLILRFPMQLKIIDRTDTLLKKALKFINSEKMKYKLWWISKKLGPFFLVSLKIPKRAQ